MAASIVRFSAFLCVVLLAGCETLLEGGLQPEPLKAGTDWDHARKVGNSPSLVDRDPAVARLTPLVKQNPEDSLPKLVEALEAGKTDPFERVRAIHDWITRNIAYDFSAYQGKTPTIVEPYAVLRHGSSVCQGYSNLFTLMCTLAGIQSQVVTGYGRGYGFDPFTEDSQPYQSNHAWNAVLVDGGWYLVDTTWDAGGIEGQANTFKWQYSTGFLFTPPDVFLCTHYPEDPRWQLLDQALDLAHFRAQPVLWGDFGTLGLERKSDFQRVLNVGDEGSVSIRVPPDVQLSGYLGGEGISSQASMSLVAQKREGDIVSLTSLFPKPGRYSLALFKDGNSSRAVFLGELFFVSTGGSAKRGAFVYPGAHTVGLTMEAQAGYLYRVGGTASFTFDCPQEVMVLLSDQQSTDLQSRAKVEKVGSHRTVTLSFPKPGDYTVTLAAKLDAGSETWTGIASLTYLALEGAAVEYPQVSERGVQMGVTMDSAGYDPKAAGETQFSLRVHAPLLVSLLDSANKDIRGHVFVSVDGDVKTVRVSFPGPGSYRVWVSALAPGQSNKWEGVALLHFDATAPGRVFPTMYPDQDQLGFQLVAPLDGVLNAGQDARFEVRGPAHGAVYVQNGTARVQLRGETGTYTGVVHLQAGSLTVFASANQGGASVGVGEYQVR
jgi:hypothetical protein